MQKYHGKVIKYGSGAEFFRKLPKRQDFVDLAEFKLNKSQIESKLPIMFLPNDVVEMHIKKEGRLAYTLVLIGILTSGAKSVLMIDGIRPFFDVKVVDVTEENTNNFDVVEYQKNLIARFRMNGCFPIDAELIERFPFLYYQEKPSSYIRIYFNTLHARKLALKYAIDNHMTTASNDESCYYRKVAREYKFKLCGWNQIKNYEIDESNEYFKKTVRYVFSCDVLEVTDIVKLGIDIQSDIRKYSNLLKDKSMMATWDIETDSNFPDGSVPDKRRIYDARGELDVIRMEANTFFWHYDREKPLVQVNITDMLAPPRDDCMIIICKNQKEILKTKSLLIERMAPEFYAAFNDGEYDWPFEMNRAEHYDLIDFMKKHMTVFTWTDESEKYLITGRKKEIIKIEADKNVDYDFFRIPGFICIDTRIVFRQLYPVEEQSSLNFFLAKNKLPSKEDMPYFTMFKIFKLIREIAAIVFSDNDEQTYQEVVEYLEKVKTKHGPDFIMFPDDKQISYKINKLSVSTIIELVGRATDVVHYCNIDAKRCQDLLQIRNIINDRRKVSNLAYTSMYDACFRAGGMKVKNLVIAEGIEPSWNIVFNAISGGIKNGSKYPGAYVVPPKKGLYRDHKSVKQARLDKINQTGSVAQNDPKDLVRNIDTNCKTDRPCSGLDFSSLYPSIIMCYNLSPEKAILDEKYKNFIGQKLDRYARQPRFIEVKFRYGLQDEAEENKQLIHGWFVQHTPITVGKQTNYEGMGLYPAILKKLFDQRAQVKKRLEPLSNTKEFLDFCFVSCSLKILATKTLEEQFTFITSILDSEMLKREADWKKSQKPYWKEKHQKICEISEIIRSELKEPISTFYEDLVFKINYLNTEQNALKVFMNTFYGLAGDASSPFFIPHVAGGVTTWGQRNLKYIIAFLLELGFEIKYGDSVTADTPILCRRIDKSITYKTIQEIAHTWTIVEYGSETKEHADTDEPLEVWGIGGWTNINKVIRHKTNKKIYRINHSAGSVDVTEDHSLLDETGSKVKPTQVKVGSKLLKQYSPYVEESNPYHSNISIKEAWFFGYFYVNGSCNQEHWEINNTNITNLIRAKTIASELYTNVSFEIVEDDGVTFKINVNEINFIKMFHAAFYEGSSKKVPDIILNGKTHIQKTFLEGFNMIDNNNMLDSKLSKSGIFYLNHIGHDIIENRIEQITILQNDEQYVYDLSTENHTFGVGPGQLIVHNTDSSYISLAEKYFEEVDKLYESGKITKAEYWTKMIEITMEVLDKIKDEVGELLFKDNGTRFLKMAYEEVLMPYIFTGKKKYIGVQHQGLVNLSICMPECTVDQFRNSKSLFVKGLEIKKRGTSEFLKIICYEFLKETFCIETTKTLKEICLEVIGKIPNRKWNPETFIRTAEYKLAKPGKPGNVTVKAFAERMREIQNVRPDLGIQEPELGERFKYVVVKKYPWTYDIAGRVRHLKVGEKYEYYQSLENQAYCEYIKQTENMELEIDIDYYVSNEIIGQIARFIIYDPEYDTFIDEAKLLDDKAYKIADAAAHNFAKKKLTNYYEELFGTKWIPKGKLYKRIFKIADDALNDQLEEKIGSVSFLFKTANKITNKLDLTKSENDGQDDVNFAKDINPLHLKKEIKDKFLKLAKKQGEKQGKIWINNIIKKLEISPFNLYRYYITKDNAICKLRKNAAKICLIEQSKELVALIPKFLELCIPNNQILTRLISEVKNTEQIENDENIDESFITQLIQETVEDETLEFEQDALELLGKLWNCFCYISAAYRTFYECDLIKNELDYLKALKVGNITQPAIIVAKNKNKDVNKSFNDWFNNMHSSKE
jgi:DNA polymerase elongation subunit (family B)